jgi:hypothetical protein
MELVCVITNYPLEPRVIYVCEFLELFTVSGGSLANTTQSYGKCRDPIMFVFTVYSAGMITCATESNYACLDMRRSLVLCYHAMYYN